MSDLKLELVVHPLCPYAQRTLYTSSFKSIPAEIIHVATFEPEAWFLDLNTLGEVPVLKITKGETVYKLTESLNISEYFDSCPGPALYPRASDGKVDPIKKGIIDVFIKNKIGRFISAYYSVMYWKPSEEEIAEFHQIFTEISGYLEEGYILDKVFETHQITFADLMILPYVERIHALKDQFPENLHIDGLPVILAYYERVSAEPWAQTHKAPPSRLVNGLAKVKAHGYEGLRLPITYYD